jgi:hypothetical protein
MTAEQIREAFAKISDVKAAFDVILTKPQDYNLKCQLIREYFGLRVKFIKAKDTTDKAFFKALSDQSENIRQQLSALSQSV